MKKLLFSGMILALAISLVSCGANRKLGCPSSAKAGQSKNVIS